MRNAIAGVLVLVVVFAIAFALGVQDRPPSQPYDPDTKRWASTTRGIDDLIGNFAHYSDENSGAVANLTLNDVSSASLLGEDLPRKNPKEIIFCDVLGDRSSREECAYFREILSRLEVGDGGLLLPPEIVRGETATVSFVVTRDPKSAPAQVLLGRQATEVFELKVGRRMAALLQGDGFKIEPGGLQHRDLFVGKGARFDWRVTPQKALGYRLILSAYVVIPASDGSKKESLLKTIERDVPVTVTWGQWADDWLTDTITWLKKGTNGLKALGLLLLALGSVIVAYRKLWKPRRKRKV